MKIKTSSQVFDPSNKVPLDVLKHIQAMTDDLRSILLGGLSFYDKQLPFEIRMVTVISGQPNKFVMQTPYYIVGAFPILTNGATITSSSSTSLNGQFNIIVNMDVNSSQIVFLLVGNNI